MGLFNLAWLSLTYQCNSRCVWCYAGSNDSQTARGKVLDDARLDGILDLVRDLGIPRLTLIGGEPTVYPALETVISKATARSIKTVLVTNGRRLRDRSFARTLWRAGLKHAAISIEGPRDVHDRTTQVPESFDEAIGGLENALLEGMEVATNTVISAINHSHLNATVDALKHFRLKYLGFNIAGPCVEGENAHLLSPQEAAAAFEAVYLYSKSIGVETRLSTPVPVCGFSSHTIRELVRKRAVWGGPCQIVHGGNFVLDYNGDVIPCTHLTGFPLFNVFEGMRVIGRSEFIERYNSDYAALFRQRVARNASTKCDGCSEHCTGGCPLMWMRLDPEEEIKGHPSEARNALPISGMSSA